MSYVARRIEGDLPATWDLIWAVYQVRDGQSRLVCVLPDNEFVCVIIRLLEWWDNLGPVWEAWVSGEHPPNTPPGTPF